MRQTLAAPINIFSDGCAPKIAVLDGRQISCPEPFEEPISLHECHFVTGRLQEISDSEGTESLLARIGGFWSRCLMSWPSSSGA